MIINHSKMGKGKSWQLTDIIWVWPGENSNLTFLKCGTTANRSSSLDSKIKVKIVKERQKFRKLFACGDGSDKF